MVQVVTVLNDAGKVGAHRSEGFKLPSGSAHQDGRLAPESEDLSGVKLDIRGLQRKGYRPGSRFLHLRRHQVAAYRIEDRKERRYAAPVDTWLVYNGGAIRAVEIQLCHRNSP